MTALFLGPQRAGLAVTPYLTTIEYWSAPTGIEASDLVPGGTAAQQNAALYAKILGASAWVDRVVRYVMAATLDTDTRICKVDRKGYVNLPLRGIPLLELDSFSYGVTPSTQTALTGTQLVDAWLSGSVLRVPLYGATTSTPVPYMLSPSLAGREVYCTYTYVNGYANTLLANGTASSSASSITLQGTAMGIYAGTQLFIYDPNGGDEIVTVASTYTTGSLTVAGPWTRRSTDSA